MPEDSDQDEEETNYEGLDKVLDTIWENLSSRRNCESKHLPEYIKRQKKKDIL